MDKKGLTGVGVYLIIAPVVIISLFAAYFIVQNKIINLVLLSIATLMFFLTLVILLEHFFSPHNKLRKKLDKVSYLMQDESLEEMKELYQQVYELYNKLSERKKRNFYAEVTEMRENIERKLKATKKMELLISNIGKGGISEQIKNYKQMYEIYKRLSDKGKQKYYSHIVHAKNLLEKGSKN